MRTKFGNAKLTGDGYYVISSRKEGNHNKKLHRLIYEDFYGIKIPENYHIHHIDGDKANNSIDNLELLSKEEHISLHKKDRVLSLETRRKCSKSRNSTGYFGVTIQKNKNIKQGFRYVYQYVENGKHKMISSRFIDVLRDKVLEKGLYWEEYETEGEF